MCNKKKSAPFYYRAIGSFIAYTYTFDLKNKTLPGNQNKAGGVILRSDKIDFNPKKITRDKDEHLYNDKREIPPGRHNTYYYT